MKKLAFFSPLSPLPSGVAVYADKLAERLAAHWRIIFYLGSAYEPSAAGALGEVRLHTEFRGEEDVTLFQASTGPMHAYMYPYILKHGGIVTLHDSTLYDMVVLYWEGRSRARFWWDFFMNEGFGGVKRAVAPLPKGDGKISQRIMYNLYTDEENKRTNFPFLKRVSRRARGLIAHSRWVADAARRAGARCPLMVIPLAVERAPEWMPSPAARESLGLEKLGIGPGTFVALAYGYIQRHKRIEPILEAWSRFSAETSDAKLLLVGPRSPDLDIDTAIAERKG